MGRIQDNAVAACGEASSQGPETTTRISALLYPSSVMSDERILGDSNFVNSIILQSEEQFERRHKLKLHGFDIHRIAARVAEVLEMELAEVFSKGRQARKVRARSLLCFWAARELGMSHTALAKKFEMSLAGIGFSVERGESIAKAGKYLLVN